MNYGVKEGSETKAYSAQLPEYRFVADPTATFDMAGLRGNLPVIVTQGSATENVVPDSVRITMVTKSSPSSEMTSVLRGDGLTLDPPVLTEFGGWSTSLHSPIEPPQLFKLKSTLEALQQRFKNQIMSMTWQPHIPSESNASNVSGIARADADKQAQDLAVVSHIARGSDWSLYSDGCALKASQ